MGELGNKMIKIGIVYSYLQRYECNESTFKVYINWLESDEVHFQYRLLDKNRL